MSPLKDHLLNSSVVFSQMPPANNEERGHQDIAQNQTLFLQD